MDLKDIAKMIRAVANAQSANKQEIMSEIKKLDKKLSTKIDKLDKKLSTKIDKNSNRLDSIGSSLAYLEDDAPTRKEHNNHERRLKKLESKVFA